MPRKNSCCLEVDQTKDTKLEGGEGGSPTRPQRRQQPLNFTEPGAPTDEVRPEVVPSRGSRRKKTL